MARASHNIVEVVVLGAVPKFQNKQSKISLIWGVPSRDVNIRVTTEISTRLSFVDTLFNRVITHCDSAF